MITSRCRNFVSPAQCPRNKATRGNERVETRGPLLLSSSPDFALRVITGLDPVIYRGAVQLQITVSGSLMTTREELS